MKLIWHIIYYVIFVVLSVTNRIKKYIYAIKYYKNFLLHFMFEYDTVNAYYCIIIKEEE